MDVQDAPRLETGTDEYEARLTVDRLQREVFDQPDPSASQALLDELAAAEAHLRAVEAERQKARPPDSSAGLILRAGQATSTERSAATTGLDARVQLNMAHVPTAFYHLLDATKTPLLTATVKATGRGADDTNIRRVRVSSWIEGYSAPAISTAEIQVNGDPFTCQHLPTLFPQAIAQLGELTRATLRVQIEDLKGDLELQQTQPIWMLARTCAPLGVLDPTTGEWQDLAPYLGAFVTPNAPSLMTFLREAARCHPSGRLVGYQGERANVEVQVKALFKALQAADITYVNSTITFNPQQGFTSQRVRLPRESLADKQANCIDGTVLFASLLEGISLSPAIVLVPGHAFVAWQTWRADEDEWRYLETTMLGTSSFEAAAQAAEATARRFSEAEQLRRLPLRQLRTVDGITPME